jgi:hypothetical protein
MNYSTFDTYNFFIKKDSTSPVLKFPLTQHLMEKYDITENILENIAVTFSMIDADTGQYRIANVAGNLIINNDRANYPDEEKYTLTYKFTLPNTKKEGNYLGEFVIDILGNENCGKIKLPVNNYINITISDSITKTTVV